MGAGGETIMRTAVTAIFLLAGSAQAIAAGTSSTMDISRYLIGQAPAAFGYVRAPLPPQPLQSAPVERAAALNGSLYAVIAPTFNGAGGTTSFIRLFNGAAGTTTFSVSVLGSPSGTMYGTASIPVARNAAPQYSLNDILAAAGAGGLANGDTSYALYIQNPEPTAGFQHVTFNAANAFFENNSICRALLNEAVATVANTVVLTNVHSTVLANYPSTISLHNFWNAPVMYRLTMIAARTGTVLGQMDLNTAANASYDIPVAAFEAQIGFTPASNQEHLNIFITDPTGAPPADLAGQAIVNNALAAQINMSTTCAVNPPPAATTGTGGLNGY